MVACDVPCHGCFQTLSSGGHFGFQSRDARKLRSFLGAGQSCPCRTRAQTLHGNAGENHLMRGPSDRWQRRRINGAEQTIRVIELTEQKRTAGLEMASVHGIEAIAVLFQRGLGCGELFHWPTQLSGDKGDLGLSDHTAGVGEGLFGTKGSCGPLQKMLGLGQITQLCHGDASQRQSGCVLAQRHAIQRTQGISRSEGGGSRSDERVHE